MSIQLKQQQIHNEVNLNLRETEKFLERIDGFSMKSLESLSFIHVSGSKGKGSVCTLTDAILREFNVKTGLFTSPHLETCRERIKLMGQPISKAAFNKYFWEVYDALDAKKSHPDDRPSFFKFLQIMAFYIFVKEQVDVAIVEVGIGGEYDSTNIIRNTEIVGITALQLEHTQLLGNKLEEIAWQKAGIIKKDSDVFYMQHTTESVNDVIRNRFTELKGKRLSAVPHIDLELKKNSAEINKINFSMAAQMSACWLRNRNILPEASFKNGLFVSVDEKFKRAAQTCEIDGRFQEIKADGVNFFIDGAHTVDSMAIASEWFASCIESGSLNVLLFNLTGDRDAKQILEELHAVPFDLVCFSTNLEYEKGTKHNGEFLHFLGDLITVCSKFFFKFNIIDWIFFVFLRIIFLNFEKPLGTI